MNNEFRLLLALIDEAYERKSWHGTNLRGSIRGLTAEEASWRPSKGRHNIREIVVHAAYWKYTIRRRLTAEKRGSFPLKGSNWFARPSPGGAGSWEEDVELLRAEHRSMRSAIAGLAPDMLYRRGAGSTVANDHLIRGIAAHDLYHAGQIQLLKRLQRQG
jgi:uncharacterized damage-inducible protein DinB